MKYFNPYSHVDFIGFFQTLGSRLYQAITGSVNEMASDEIQLLVLCLVAISTSLVGTFLVLRRMTMLANSLSHTILVGIVLVFVFTKSAALPGEHGYHTEINIQAMLLAAVLTGLVTAYLTEFLTKTIRLQPDASTGIVFTTLFALGVILVTLLTRDAHIGTEIVMGNVDGLNKSDCQLVAIIMGLNVFMIALFFKEYNITTFDPPLAKALGFSVVFFDYLLMSQVSITAIGAFRAVGVLMVLAFITGPALTARLLTHSLKKMLLLSTGVGVLAAVLGVALSRHILTVYGIPLTTGGVTVCLLGLIYFVTAAGCLIKKSQQRKMLKESI